MKHPRQTNWLSLIFMAATTIGMVALINLLPQSTNAKNVSPEQGKNLAAEPMHMVSKSPYGNLDFQNPVQP